jgi:hypothetical protein
MTIDKDCIPIPVRKINEHRMMYDVPKWDPSGALAYAPLMKIEAEELLVAAHAHAGAHDLWVGRNFMVTVRNRGIYPIFGEVKSITFTHHNGAIRRDPREYVLMMRQILGETYTGIEVYPSESALVDNSNCFHLWCFTKRLNLPRVEPKHWIPNVEAAAPWDPDASVPWQPLYDRFAVPLIDGAVDIARNDLYVAALGGQNDHPDLGKISTLVIDSTSGKPRRDWREWQRVKNEMTSPDASAIEVFPAYEPPPELLSSFGLLYVLPSPLPFSLNKGRRQVSIPTRTTDLPTRLWHPDDLPRDTMIVDETVTTIYIGN